MPKAFLSSRRKDRNIMTYVQRYAQTEQFLLLPLYDTTHP